MSTRSQLRFVQCIAQETDDGETKTSVRVAQIYRHSDGYPDAVLPALQRLQTLLRTTRTERGRRIRRRRSSTSRSAGR